MFQHVNKAKHRSNSFMHTSARPRESILNLFDPLNPARTSSDKENSYSLFDYECPVDRALLTHTSKHSSPVLLKRRLVDIGDITLDDSFDLSTPNRLDKSNNTTTSVPDGTITPFKPNHTVALDVGLRTPLGELVVDQNTILATRTQVYNRQLPYTPTPAISRNLEESMAVKPKDLDVTASEPTRYSQKSSDMSGETQVPDREIPQFRFEFNEHLVSPTTSDKTPTRNSLFPPVPLSPSLESAHLRPKPLNTPFLDHNRHSIDLHSSFQLHFQTEDASFDLLNDKISLFASAHDPRLFLDTEDGEDDFAVSPEETRDKNSALRTQSEADNDARRIAVVGVHSDTIHALTPENPLPTITNKDGMTQNSSRQNKRQSCSTVKDPQGSQGPSVNPNIPHPTSHLSVKESASPPEAVQTPAIFSRMIKPPPLVPALRIVKRANRLRSNAPGKSPAVSVTSETPTGGKPATPPTSSGCTSNMTAQQKSAVFTSHVNDRTRHTTTTETNRNTCSSKTNGRPMHMMLEDCQNMYPSKLNDGPRRVLVTDTRQTEPKEKPLNATGPRRVVVTSSDNPSSSTASSQARSKVPASHSYKTTTQRTETTTLPSSSLSRPAIRPPNGSTSGLPRPTTSVHNVGTRNGVAKQSDIRRAALPRRGAQ